MKKNYPIILQQNKSDCGVACLHMIFNYHGINISYDKLKQLTRTNDNGTNALNLINASKKLGFDAKGVTMEIVPDITFPIIAHLILENNFSHFVVIYEINPQTKELLVADPNCGMYNISMNEFLKKSSKVFIMITKKGNLKVKDKRFYNAMKELIFENKKSVIKSFILAIIVICLSLMQTVYVKTMMERINYNEFLFMIAVIFFSISIIKNVLEYFKNKIMDNLSISIDAKINAGMYTHLFKLPYQYLNKKQEGEIFTIINDVSDFKDSVNRIILVFLVDLLMLLATLIFLSFVNFIFAIFCILLLFSLYFITYYYKYDFYQMFLTIKNKSIVVASYLIESLSSIITIKNLNIYDKITQNLKNKHMDYLCYIKKYNHMFNKFNAIKNACSDVFFIASILVGSLLVNKNLLSIYDLILFESMFYIFSGSLNNILDLLITSKNYLVGINKVLDLYGAKEEKRQNNKILTCKQIEINNLSFKYDDKEVFNNLNLIINPGDKILLTGVSGSGKTTLINIFMKYINNYQGKVLFDNQDIKKIDAFSIRDVIGYVSQNEKLFSDTIYNNIVMGNKYKNNIDEICSIAKINTILMEKSIDINYYLDPNSSNLSGGEKKRIILARTLLKNSSILILDEVFNEIDINMEKEILTSLFNTYRNKIIIVITHRLDNKNLFNRYWQINNKTIEEGERI